MWIRKRLVGGNQTLAQLTGFVITTVAARLLARPILQEYDAFTVELAMNPAESGKLCSLAIGALLGTLEVFVFGPGESKFITFIRPKLEMCRRIVHYSKPVRWMIYHRDLLAKPAKTVLPF